MLLHASIGYHVIVQRFVYGYLSELTNMEVNSGSVILTELIFHSSDSVDTDSN
ncbi:MAG: hypothetical protein J07HQW2_01901 [Haloquadratum walsbyi J07HQW2]|uniref:Uncharacterized protein n=1 Tax=Haloquadratum walsbyi J07HQW2 TaxID=1238425 RepID=U1MY86_9EURY|nr:MAG: hypothetical protein J07HQW2_01901 [Haloquadratum walsbyi J07HQW2]